jgi:hypothetical protein
MITMNSVLWYGCQFITTTTHRVTRSWALFSQ